MQCIGNIVPTACVRCVLKRVCEGMAVQVKCIVATTSEAEKGGAKLGTRKARSTKGALQGRNICEFYFQA
jgi:hypothetical protein